MTDDYAPLPPDPQPQRSIAAPLLRALLFAAIAFGVYYLVFEDPLATGTDLTEATEAPATAVATAPAAAATTPPPLEAMPSNAPTEQPVIGDAPTPDPSASPGATDTASPGGDVGAGVSVQVIAGADTSAAQFDAAVAALVELGYDVTESGISPNPYPTTTVFATPGEESQAETLTTTDDRFTSFDPEFPGLNEAIQLHVLVGEDWPTS